MNIKKAYIDDDIGAVYWKDCKGNICYPLIQDDGSIDFEDHSTEDYPESLQCYIQATFG